MKPTHYENVRGREDNDRPNLTSRPTSLPCESNPQRVSTECSQFLAELKDRVAAELSSEFRTVGPRLIRQVVNEADSLAATTPFPALLFPALAEEKARNASAWATRQRIIREQTWSLAA